MSMTKKVKIKTWTELLKMGDRAVDDIGEINCPDGTKNSFVDCMENLMPKDRVIEVLVCLTHNKWYPKGEYNKWYPEGAMSYWIIEDWMIDNSGGTDDD